MIMLGCLLALGLAIAPRLFLVLAWIFANRWPIVWGDAWIAPLLGIIFLPYTTAMYLLAWTTMGIVGTAWLWIILGLFLDATHYYQGAMHRQQVPGYPAAAAPPAAAPSQEGPSDTGYSGT